MALTRLYTALRDIDWAESCIVDWDEAHARRFREAMDDDFNTPMAVAALFDLAGRNQSEQVAGDRRASCGAGRVSACWHAGSAAVPARASDDDTAGIER